MVRAARILSPALGERLGVSTWLRSSVVELAAAPEAAYDEHYGAYALA